MRSARIALALACLLATGCLTYSLVKPGSHKIGRFYSVESPIAWSKAKAGKHAELWTVEGPMLESVRFTHGTPDGKPLFPVTGEDEQQLLYRASMSETEIMELVVDNMARMGFGSVAPSGLEPARFGGREGFRFEVEYVTRDGLPCRGLAVGTVADAKLYLILYTGARDHYYDRYLPRVQAMIDSIRILEAS